MKPGNAAWGEAHATFPRWHPLSWRRKHDPKSATLGNRMAFRQPPPGSNANDPPRTGINRRHLRVQDLRRLSRVAFSPRRRIEGLYAGRHATPLRGQSIEFRDYRQYIPGDEVGSIDWKVYGRSDRLYIRLFEHQAEMTVHLLVDASASMAYHGLTTRPTTSQRRRRGRVKQPEEHRKFDQACFLAAAVGFVLARQHDRFSFCLAQRGMTAVHPSGNSMRHLAAILDTMEQTIIDGPSALPAAIHSLAATASRRDLLMIFSDLLDDPPAIQKALSAWQHRGGEVILFQVLHPHELTLPEMDYGVFVDSESNDSVRLNVADIRDNYDCRMREFLEGWQRACSARGIDHNVVPTDVPYHQTLEKYLVHRASLK